MIHHVIDIIRWRSWRKRWKKRNKHNFCEIQSKFNMNNVHIGRKTYGMINAHIYNNEKEQLYIGSFCSIAENVHFVFGGHDYTRFCSYPFDEFILEKAEQNPTKGEIVIEDDVWIGMNCLILSGVTIHRGAVIGAGTVVTQDVPAYAVYAGGRIIKYRFSKDIIDKLMKIDYELLTDDVIKRYRDDLYKSVDDKFFETDFYQSIIRNEGQNNG